MASGKIPALVIIVTLTLLIYFTTAREWHPIDHMAPESAPVSSPDYAPVPLSGGIIIGNLEPSPSPSPSMYEKKIVASNNCGNGGSTWGGYGGNYGGGMGGSAGSGGMSGMTGNGGMTYSGGGLQRSAAGIASSSVGRVAFSTVLLAAILMYL